MSDARSQGSPPPPVGTRKPLLHRLRMSRANGWLVAAPSLLIALGVADYFRHFEGSGPNLICTAAITLALWATLAMATRRALASTILIGAMNGFIVGVAFLKRSVEKMAFHAYDL